MFDKIKRWLGPTKEDLELADKIRKLYETHDVTVRVSSRGWRVSVNKKKESK